MRLRHQAVVEEVDYRVIRSGPSPALAMSDTARFPCVTANNRILQAVVFYLDLTDYPARTLRYVAGNLTKSCLPFPE
jgi:hypothetical protein